MSRLYYDYKRICESGECIIRRQINAFIDSDKPYVRKLIREYCTTCVLRKIMIHELKRSGKL